VSEISESTSVGAISAKITADVSGYNAGINSAKAKAKELGEAGKAASTSFGALNTKMRELGASSAQITKINDALKKANPDILRKQIAEVTKEMRALGASSSEIGKVTSELEKSATSSKHTTNEVKALGVAYIGLAVAMTAIISKSVETAATFEQSMANVKAISEATGAEFEKLRNQALNLGATTKFTAAEAADAQALLAQAGMKTNQIIASMPGVLALAAAGQVDLATTASITASALNGFGLAAEDSARVADVLAKSSIDTNADVTDLGMALKYVAPVAAAMGVSIEVAVAAIGELSNAGIKGEMAGTQMRAMLLALASPSKEAAGYMEKLGVSISDSAGNIKPFSTIIGDLQGAFTRLTQVQQADVAATLVGREAASGFLTLIAQGKGTLDNYTASLENAGGTAERVAGVQMDTLKGAIAEMQSALEGVGIVVGDKFAPAIRKVTEVITNVLSGFTNLNPALQSAIIAFATVVPLVLGLAAAVGALSIAFAGLSVSFPILGAISLAIGAVVAGITYLVGGSMEAAAAVKQHDEAQKSLNETLNQSPASRTVSELEDLRAKTEELSTALEKRESVQRRINEIEALGEKGLGTPQLLSEMMDINDELSDMDDKLRGMGYDGVEDATSKLTEMNGAIENSVSALFDEKEAEMADLAAKHQKITAMETTLKRYNELASSQSLDNAQKQELIALTKSLRGEYPQLNASIDDNNRIRIENIDVVSGQIQADRNFITQNAASSKAYMQNLITTTEAQRKAISAQIANYQALISVMQAATGAQQGPVKQKVGGFYNPADELTDMQVKRMSAAEEAKMAEAYKEQERLVGVQREMEDSLAKLTNGEIPTGKITTGAGIDLSDPKKTKTAKAKAAKKEKSAAEIAAELRKKMYDADVATIRYQADMYDWSADQQIASYGKIRIKHKQFLAESVDDERTLNLQVKRLSEDSAKSRYDFSAEWIKKEERQMQDSGKSEIAVAEAKLASWTRVLGRYKKDSDEYKQADEEVYKAHKELINAQETDAKRQYDASNAWITQESRRMEDSGKSESQIAQMKLEAWTRLRDRYAKDSELYKKADEEVYQARKDLKAKTIKLAEELVKVQKSAIDDAKKADLDAIEARKIAYISAQDAKIKAIDDLLAKEEELNIAADFDTQLREKNARIDELASAVGPDGIAEREQAIKDRDKMILDRDRELRKAELNSQKTALQEEKDTQLNAFEAEKNATTAQFDALKSAFDSYSGDIKTIEAILAEFRVSEAGKANSTILAELDTFVSQYNAKMATVSALSGNNDLSEYNANKDAWATAKASGNKSEMDRLSARNEELRKQYGISSDTGKLQAFKDGGVVLGASGSAVPIVAHAGEMFLNAQQQSTLFGMLSGRVSAAPAVSGASNSTSIVNHIDMSVGEVVLTDKADITTLYDERSRIAARTQTLGVKGL